jgi:hypothetical protein
MNDLTVPITPRAHQTLQELSNLTGDPLPVVLDKAVEAYRRKQFLEGLSADFAALRQNPAAWQEELQERADWDATLADDLEREND